MDNATPYKDKFIESLSFQRIVDIFGPLGIKVLDHIIVGDNTYTSLVEKGIMPINRYTADYHPPSNTASIKENADDFWEDIEAGGITEFSDWKDVARLVYINSGKNITMYRSIISFRRETAEELMLKNQKDWQRYVEKHILTIARQNNIKAAGGALHL